MACWKRPRELLMKRLRMRAAKQKANTIRGDWRRRISPVAKLGRDLSESIVAVDFEA